MDGHNGQSDPRASNQRKRTSAAWVTYNRSVHLPYRGTTSATVWTVSGIAGVGRTFKFCNSPVTLQTSFGVNAPDYGPGSVPMLTAIVLPDFTMWTFAYDSYGDVNRLGFPTGESISYTYITGLNQCNGDTQLSKWVASRTVDANDGTGSHTWNYTYAASGQNGYSATTKVTMTGES
jgi:hypothetical protein